MKNQIKKRITKIATIVSVTAMIMGNCIGCGNNVDIDNAETTNLEPEVVAEETVDESTFGLQDFEGFYCKTTSEQIEDYEVTYTYGYLFNGDGTGVCYGQDIVDITWNETEIHFADSTVSYEMKPGELTVGDVTYKKIEGNFIAPYPCDVDTDNIADGIYYASIADSGISETDGIVTISAEIYTLDSYDIVDVNRMAAGDVIYINGQLMPIETVDKLDSGAIEINGGIENMGSALRPEEESNCYVFFGMDDLRSYTCKGVAVLTLSDDAKLFDNSDPTVVNESTGSDVFPALKKLVENYPLNCYNCRILVEDGAIVEINRMYTP